MVKIETVIGGKICRIYADESPENIIIQPTGKHEIGQLDEEVKMIKDKSGKPIAFVAFQVTNWNAELSPWKARQAFGDSCFGDGAELTLKYISENLMPELCLQIKVNENAKYILGGYSLAGLFSLWCAYQTEIFYAVAACSPSVWIDGWKEFSECHKPLASHIYLSLGTKEHKTRNPLLRGVKSAVTEQFDRLNNAGVDTLLEWNIGNHFQDNAKRMAEGPLWCIGC